jgi:hypothetical protein
VSAIFLRGLGLVYLYGLFAVMTTTRPELVEWPRLLRARRYRYHFTSAAERARTGAWWRREGGEPFCPAVLSTAQGPVATDWPPRFAPAPGRPP